MITLSRTTDSVEAFLDAPAATSEPRVALSYHEVIRTAKGDVGEYPRGTQLTELAGTTHTTILAAPENSETCKHVDSIVIHNRDTAAITVTVVIDRSSVHYVQMLATLGVDYTLHGEFYLGGRGWYVTDPEGAIVTSAPEILETGVYTPTLSNTTNVAGSTAYECQYMRLGSRVVVSGRVDIDPTAAAPTATLLGMSLPIPSSISNAIQLGGVAFCVSTQQGSGILGDATNDRASFQYSANNTANQQFDFIFMYQII